VATELIGFGLPITLSATTTIGLSLVVTNGSSDVTLNSSDAANPTLAAATYDVPSLVAKLPGLIRTWIYDAMVADAGITTKPSAASGITVSMSLTPSATMNGSAVSLVVGSALAGAEIGGVAATVKSLTLSNSNAFWTKLGLTYEADSSRTINHSSNICTASSLFQSPYFYCFELSTEDTFDAPMAVNRQALVLADGKVVSYESGRTIWRRELGLIDHDGESGHSHGPESEPVPDEPHAPLLPERPHHERRPLPHRLARGPHP
jgi:hypothetical protein